MVIKMALVYKQLFKQMIKDRIFLSLLFLLTVLTSLSFFFVTGSIDANMRILNGLESLTQNQQLYKNALQSNQILAYTFWLSLVSLSAVVFVMFFYRFFRANQKQIGCIKMLGFKNSRVQSFFIAFTAGLSVWGAVAGLVLGYFLSDILISANAETYNVTGLTKGISGFSFIIGVVASSVIFSMVALLCYGFVRNKEAGFLLAGNNTQNRFLVTLKICRFKNQRFFNLPFRIALRKPLSVLLLFVSVMSFQVCIILGQSLYLSSAKIFHAQTAGHNYAYQIQYQAYQTTKIPSNAMVYMDNTAVITTEKNALERTLTGLYDINELYELKNKNDVLLTVPNAGCVYINPELSEIYGVQIGDLLMVTVAGKQCQFLVKEIAVNAQTNHIYGNAQQLAQILDITAGAYNGAFSADKLEGGITTSKAQRIEEINRNAVSNQTSAVINQATGVLVGMVLIFLALHISFQDNIHDILILHMLGHSVKSIRKLFVDIYLPILWGAFVLTLAPSILLARSIQNSLSVSTNDYMPFGINLFVVLIAFLLMNLIYYGVQAVFRLRIKQVIKKEKITDVIYAD